MVKSEVDIDTLLDQWQNWDRAGLAHPFPLFFCISPVYKFPSKKMFNPLIVLLTLEV